MKISETCSCGSTFQADSQNNYELAVNKAVATWRKDHRHEFARVAPIAAPAPMSTRCECWDLSKGVHYRKCPKWTRDQPTTDPNGARP